MRSRLKKCSKLEIALPPSIDDPSREAAASKALSQLVVRSCSAGANRLYKIVLQIPEAKTPIKTINLT